MSSEWIDTTLGEVCAAQNGAIQTGPFGSQLHASDYVEMGIPVVMPSNIGPDGGISEDGIARIKQEDADRLSQHKLQIGDVVFSRRGDVTRNALIEPHQVGWLCGTGCLKVRLGDERKADAKFISYCLRLPETKEWLIRHAVGATMPNLNTAILSAVPIQIPPISEQKKITNLLRALDDRIALLRETNATLEAIAQALFKSWFVDFDPVHANAAFLENGQAPSLPAEIQALFPSRLVESPQGLIPEGWSWKRLDEAYEINPKRQLKKGVVAKYLDMASVQTQGHVTADVNDREFGSGTKFCNGDTLLARITPCLENGKTAFVDFLEDDEIGWGSTEFVVLRPKAPLPEFHGYLLARQPFFRQFAIRSMSGTSGRQRVQNDALGSFNLAAPDKEVAEAFDQVVTPIQQSISANHKKAQTLANLRDTLLPRLISGQLRLPEAEAALAEVG